MRRGGAAWRCSRSRQPLRAPPSRAPTSSSPRRRRSGPNTTRRRRRRQRRPPSSWSSATTPACSARVPGGARRRTIRPRRTCSTPSPSCGAPPRPPTRSTPSGCRSRRRGGRGRLHPPRPRAARRHRGLRRPGPRRAAGVAKRPERPASRASARRSSTVCAASQRRPSGRAAPAAQPRTTASACWRATAPQGRAVPLRDRATQQRRGGGVDVATITHHGAYSATYVRGHGSRMVASFPTASRPSISPSRAGTDFGPEGDRVYRTHRPAHGRRRRQRSSTSPVPRMPEDALFNRQVWRAADGSVLRQLEPVF